MKVFGNKLKQNIFRRGMDSLQKSLHDAQSLDNRIKMPKNFKRICEFSNESNGKDNMT